TRRHTRAKRDWSADVCSSDLVGNSRRSGAPAIEAENLVKTFGDFTAVDDISFTVPTGTVLGLLGPNGAGKTTVVRMMTTLSPPRSEERRVGKARPQRQAPNR